MGDFNIHNIVRRLIKAGFYIVLSFTSLVSADNSISVILTVQDTVKDCDSVELSIQIKNISERTLDIPAIMKPGIYMVDLIITDKDTNHRVLYSGSENKLIGIKDSVILYPDYSLGVDLRLSSKNYDICSNKNYAIKAIYGGDTYTHLGILPLVESNELSFKIQ